MRAVRGFLVYVMYPLILLGIGFVVGIVAIDFFYPGRTQQNREEEILAAREQQYENGEAQTGNGAAGSLTGKYAGTGYSGNESGGSEYSGIQYDGSEYSGIHNGSEYGGIKAGDEATDMVPVQSFGEKLCVDTEYVLEETDVIKETVVETSWRLPEKYVGMNREQFVEAMEIYELSPPLSELERGFVSLEVLSFSRERVTVQMNYQYVQPGTSFYLAVMDNEVVVYLEDMETIYINTGIALEALPEKMQMEIIQMLWIEDEERLYDFLETYSS